MFWSPQKIDTAQKVLNKSKTVSQAVRELKKQGINTTPSALRSAFNRSSLLPPHAYLDGAVYGTVVPEVLNVGRVAAKKSKGAPDWSGAMVDSAKKILHHFKSVVSALPELNRALGIKVTDSTLREAFELAGEEAPESFLKPLTKPKGVLSPKEEVLDRLEKNERRRERKVQGITEIIWDNLQVALEKIEPTQVKVVREPSPKRVKTQEEELIVAHFSDLQMGSLVIPERVGYLNSTGHNWAAFISKLHVWRDSLKDLIKERRQNVIVNTVGVFMLGDSIENTQTFPSQVFSTDKDLFKQVTHGEECISQVLIDLCFSFPDIKFQVPCVAGNHGRYGKFGEMPYHCNFEILLYRMIEQRVKAAGVKNIEFYIPDSWFMFVRTWDYLHLLTHGDQIKGTGTTPMAGLKKAIAAYQQMAQPDLPLLASHFGHFHVPNLGYLSGNSVALINGCFPGTTDYCRDLLETSIPAQMVHGFTRHGHSWTRKILLQPGAELKPRLDIKTIV